MAPIILEPKYLELPRSMILPGQPYRPSRIATPATIASTADTCTILTALILTNDVTPVTTSQTPNKSMPQFLLRVHNISRSSRHVIHVLSLYGEEKGPTFIRPIRASSLQLYCKERA